ncbi:MAG: AraC family transcriptional regulator [Pyrinomonadaceae bacterium]
MPRVSTVQSKAVLKIAAAVGEAGLDPAELYRAVRFDPAALADPDRRIPFAQLVALYEHGARLTNDAAFGLHIGERVSPTMFDVLGYVVTNSLTLGEAFARLARFHAIWTDGASYKLTTHDGEARLSYEYAGDICGARRHDCEMSFATPVVFMRRIAELDWHPHAVSFQHDVPADTTEHRRLFRAPILFSQPRNEMVFDAALLKLPLLQADPSLCAVLDRHAEELLARLPRGGDAGTCVRRLLAEGLGAAVPSLTSVARQLGLSPRTLQRKLNEEGTSWKDLLDEVRRNLSERYLREHEMAICEVAYLLGFSESSAFHRAFRRWTGSTPSEFRRAHAAHHPQTRRD